MGQGVPPARASLRGGVRRIEFQEPEDGRVVAQNRGGMNIGAGDLGVRRQNFIGAIQRAVPQRGIDESRSRIVCFVHRHRPPQIYRNGAPAVASLHARKRPARNAGGNRPARRFARK